MITKITEEEFDELLRTFSRSAFRLETLDTYALDYERTDFERFLAGTPVPPSETGWWRDWLDQVASLTEQGKTVARVRVLAEPPTDYQRWMVWAHPWYAHVREDIRYIPRSRAAALRLPLEVDWWLLDDERLILMHFSDVGEIISKMLISDPGIVARYREWRDLAVRNATAVEAIAAA
jgi:hypothetical protein